MLAAFVVDSLADDPWMSSADLDGQVTLREAIHAANTNSAFGDAPAGEGGGVVDTVTFHPSLAGQTLLLGGEPIVISEDLTITGLGIDVLTVSAGGLSRVLVVDATASVQVAQLTIADGVAEYGAGVESYGNLVLDAVALRNHSADDVGGAVLNDGGCLVIRGDSIVSGNHATRAGGGIWNSGDLQVEETLFLENSAANGGSIANRGGGQAAIASSTFRDNSANSGAAIENSGTALSTPSSLAVLDSTFTSNSALVGGAIWNDGPAEVRRSWFEGNQATAWGGAIENLRRIMAIEDSTFLNNSAGRYGGAIDNNWFGGGTLLVVSSTLAGNTAGRDGGAIANFLGVVEIANSTVSRNSANQFGGGIWSEGGVLNITNSTVVLNRADADGNLIGGGGGLALVASSSSTYSPPRLGNTLVAGNLRGAAGTATADDVSGVLASTSAHNLIGDASSAGGLIHGELGNQVGDDGSGTIDVALVIATELMDNGGPTWTHALVAASPAQNAGDNALAVDVDIQPLSYDQRGPGFARISGDAVDIGAYEAIQPLRVTVDIKPGLGVSAVNLASHGMMTVVIQSSAEFSAANVVAGTVVFAGAHAVSSHLEDVNGDSLPDLVLNFRIEDANLVELYAQLLAEDLEDDGVLDSRRKTVSLGLTGETVDEVFFEGADAVDLFLAGKALRDLLEQLAAAPSKQS